MSDLKVKSPDNEADTQFQQEPVYGLPNVWSGRNGPVVVAGPVKVIECMYLHCLPTGRRDELNSNL